MGFEKLLPKVKADVISAEPSERPNRIYRNYCETAITVFILRALLKVRVYKVQIDWTLCILYIVFCSQSSVNPEMVGIIAPYLSQVKLLTKAIRLLESEFKSPTPFEVNTIDQYQGRDKDIVIFSCTKSAKPTDGAGPSRNTSREFEILEDLRRLTVAITRSRHKLIILGDVNSLMEYTPFRRLFASITAMGRTAVTDDRNGFEWQPLMDQLSQLFRESD